MMRAMRVDKIILAALAATLRLYRDIPTAEESLPLLARLIAPIENLRNRAERLAPQLAAAAAISQAQAVEDKTFLGGGSVPAQQIPTWCVALTPHEMNVDELSKRLRTGTPAIVGRIQQDRLLLDLRSVLPHQDAAIVEAIGRIETDHKTNASAESA